MTSRSSSTASVASAARSKPSSAHLLTAARGAINSLLAEVLEDHVREHVLGRISAGTRAEAADELIDVIHAYFK